MKKKIILGVCMVAFACACQPTAKASQGSKDSSEDQNYHDRRMQKPQGGCCETEKLKAAPMNQQAVIAPEVKVEKAVP